MKELRFVSAQPATTYYAWQVEVMLNNFREMDVNLNQVDVVCWVEGGCNCVRNEPPVVPEEWSKLANNYAARFFFYKDHRDTKNYVSSIRPNILRQHWEAHPYLKEQAIFYHDCDIIFTKPPSQWIPSGILNDNDWYGSDTRWYIAHSYIKSKGQDVIDAMCNIMEVDEQLLEANELNSIGAQYLMKNVDAAYWDRVEKDSERLFTDISALNIQKKLADPTHHELQIWCADMWAVLWGAWRLGYKTHCLPSFEFSWATSSEEDYFKFNIMHNAGAVNSTSGLFYKADYMNYYPYNEWLDVREGTASWHYWSYVQKTADKSVLL